MAQDDRSEQLNDDPLYYVAAAVVIAFILVAMMLVLPILMFRAMYRSAKEGFLEYVNPNQVGKSSSGFEGR